MEVEPHLWEWVPIGLLPWVWGAYFGRHLGRMLPSAALGLARTLRRTGFTHPDLLLIDHPQFCNLDRVVAATRMAYRATDVYREMHDRRIVDELERRLIAAADCAIATSEPVARRLRELGAERPILIENGAEVAHFARPAARPPECAAELRNLRLLGPRPYALLPAYLQHAQAGLLPLNDHPANAGRSPMKLYEYAAAGIPVLATRTEDLARRAPQFVRFFDPHAPEATLDTMLQASPRPDAREVAAHDWSRIAKEVLATALAESARNP